MKDKHRNVPIALKAMGSMIVFFAVLAVVGKLIGYSDLNYFFQDHGSLIAGILGIVGVVFLVVNQDKNTKQTVASTLEAIHMESKEIEKRNNKRCILNIVTEVSNIVEIAQSDLKLFTHQHCGLHLKNIKENSQELLFSNFKDGRSIVFFMESFSWFCQEILKYQSGLYSTTKSEYIAHITRLKTLLLSFIDNLESDPIVLSMPNNDQRFLILEANNKIRYHLESVSFELYPTGYEDTNLLGPETLQGLHIILAKHDIYTTLLLNLNNNV